jgi:hypothetical protein
VLLVSIMEISLITSFIKSQIMAYELAILGDIRVRRRTSGRHTRPVRPSAQNRGVRLASRTAMLVEALSVEMSFLFLLGHA